MTKSSRKPGPYPYYGASGIVDHVNDYIFDGTYLLVSEDGANLLARSTPIAFTAEGKTWVNNHAHILDFDSDVIREYVEMYLNMIDLSEYVTGAAQPKLNQKNLNRIPIPILEEEGLGQVVERVKRAMKIFGSMDNALEDELALRTAQLAEFRNRLLSFQEKAA